MAQLHRCTPARALSHLIPAEYLDSSLIFHLRPQPFMSSERSSKYLLPGWHGSVQFSESQTLTCLYHGGLNCSSMGCCTSYTELQPNPDTLGIGVSHPRRNVNLNVPGPSRLWSLSLQSSFLVRLIISLTTRAFPLCQLCGAEKAADRQRNGVKHFETVC